MKEQMNVGEKKKMTRGRLKDADTIVLGAKQNLDLYLISIHVIRVVIGFIRKTHVLFIYI